MTITLSPPARGRILAALLFHDLRLRTYARLHWSHTPTRPRTCSNCAFRREWLGAEGWLACDLDAEADAIFYAPASTCHAFTPSEES